MIFNLELIPFMDLEPARNFYNLVLENIPKNDKFDEFLEYFQDTWFPIGNNLNTLYDFDLWNYSNKFKFKGNKNSLFKKGEIDKYVLFSNNAVENFNHLINQCLEKNTRVSISKFEEIIKFIFIRFTSNNESDINSNKYEEKCLVSDLLRELIELGYGKNGKVIKINDYKKIKTEFKEDLVFKLTFNEKDDLRNEDEEN